MDLHDRDDLMTPFHARWEEFLERLDEKLDRCVNLETGEDSWSCASDPDCPLATSILAVMGGIDVENSLDYLAYHGASCDCTILMNVENSVEAQQEVDDTAFLEHQQREMGDPADQPLTIALRRSEIDRLQRLAERLGQGMTVEMAAEFVIRRWLPECKLADEP